jgi:serine/threonine-protein kinase RsbW
VRRGAEELLAGLQQNEETETDLVLESVNTGLLGVGDCGLLGVDRLGLTPGGRVPMLFGLQEAGAWQDQAEQPGRHAYWHRQRIASTEEVPLVVHGVAAAMVVAGYPEKDRFGMCLALTEALVNAVQHGNHSDPTKRVRVRHQVTAVRVLVEVEDDGAGFDPRKVPDPCAPENLERPGGRGLLLMRSSMTWVRFNPRGNRVTLCKRRSHRPSEHPAGTSARNPPAGHAGPSDR